jgi:hypothetical protein
MIFASDVGNYHMEAMWLGTAMESFLKQVDEKTVGGLFPMVRLEYGGCRSPNFNAHMVRIVLKRVSRS